MQPPVSIKFIACAVVLACAVASDLGQRSAFAQAGIIDPTQPERAIERLQRSQQRSAMPPLPRSTSQSSIADRKPLFKLRAVEIRGAKTLPANALTPAYESFLGRTVSAADLSSITSGIDEIYRKADYHLTRAIVTPQNADGGRLIVTVIEGRIDEIKIRSKPTSASISAVRDLLNPLTQESPSHRATLERRLLLASDLPGVRIAETSIEEIGKTSGRFRLIVDVESWSNLSSVAFDNRGTEAVGPYQAYATTNFNSAFIPGDTLGVALSATPADNEELRFARMLYSAPLGWDGARWSLLALHSDVRPGDDRKLFETHDRAELVELRGTINPLRTQYSSVWLSGAFSAGEYSEHDVFGRVFTDHLRIVSGTVDYQQHDDLGGWNYLTVNVKQGLDILGASPAGDPYLSRSDGSGTFTKLDVAFSRIQPLIGPWSLKLAAAGQWTPSPLLASQQFYLGAAFGRGFFGLEIGGDRAIAGSAEVRFDQSVASSVLRAYQLYGYVDRSLVWNVGSDVGAAKLTLAGLGARFFLPDHFQANIELAKPVEYAIPFLQQTLGPRLFVGVSKTFKLCAGNRQLSCG